MRFALVLVLGLMLAACGGDNDADTGEVNTTATQAATSRAQATATTAPTEAATPTEAPTPTPEPTPEPTQAATVGSAITFDDGTTVTVYSMERPVVPADGLFLADEGHEYMTFDIEQCAPPDLAPDKTQSINSLNFELINVDNSRVTSTITTMEPKFTTADLLAGDCFRGLVVFEVPIGAQFKELRFEGYTADYDQLIGRWQLEG